MKENETFHLRVLYESFNKSIQINRAYSWLPVVKQVIKDCYKVVKKLKDSVVNEITPQCDNKNITLALNITRCIRRELFFRCNDTVMKSENCQLLKEFGMKCLYFPWQCYTRKVHRGNVKNQKT